MCSTLVSAVRFAGAAWIGLHLLASCGQDKEPAPEAGVPYVATSLYPLTYVAQRLLGDDVRVICPLPPEADPLHWQPDRAALELFAGAKLIALNGAGVEAWRATAGLPLSRTIDTTQAKDTELVRFEKITHSHGAGEHTHEGIDGHTWLDPLLLKAQAEVLRTAVLQAFPEHSALVHRNFAALASDLEDLDRRWRALASRLAKVNLLAAHPAYNYPAKRYGFLVTNLDLDPERELDAADFDALKLARGAREQAAVILWEVEPLEATRSRLEGELGLQSVVFSPCENPSRAELEAGLDFAGVMRRSLEALEAALPR